MLTCLLLCILASAGDTAPETPPIQSFLSRVGPVLEGVDTIPPNPNPALPLQTLDLDQCVARALEHHGRILAAAADTAAQESLVGVAKAARRPQISTQSSLSYLEDVEQGIGNSLLSNLVLQGNDFQPDNLSLRNTLKLEQLLYAGGQIAAAVRASEFLAQSKAWQETALRQQIAFEVRQAFFDAILAEALVRVALDSIATFERHRADAQAMLDAGLVSRFVTLRAETELGARQAGLESARTAHAIALINLCRLVGLPQDQPIALSGTLEWTPPEDTIDARIQRALEQRPEIRALDAGIAAAQEKIAQARGAWRPRIGASIQYQDATGAGALLPEGISAGIALDWTLYTGGRRKHEKLQAEAQLESLQHQRTDLARLVELDVRQAHARVLEAIAKIRKEKGTVALADEGLRLAQLRFKEGVGTPAEILDADLAQTQARTALVQALRDYAVARAALEKATGDAQSN